MASQYELQLRATLDTSDVQQKLNQLRQSQQSNAQGNSSSKLSTNLNQVFAKIDSSMKSLQKSIDKLSSTLSRTQTPAFQSNLMKAVAAQVAFKGSPNAPMMIPPMMNQSLSMSQSMNNMPLLDPRSWLRSTPYGRIRSQFYSNAIKSGKEKEISIGADLVTNPKFPSYNSIGFVHRAIMSGLAEKILGKEYNAASYKQLMQTYLQTRDETMRLMTPKDGPRSNKTSFNNLIQNRKFGAIIGGQLLGGAGNLATDLGYERTGAVLTGIGKGVSAGGGAAYTASLFGASDKIAGRIGGAAFAATAIVQVTKALYDLKEASEKAAQAQREIAKQQVEQGRQLGQGRFSFFDQQLARHALKVQNTTIANERLSYAKDIATQSAAKLEGMEDPLQFEKRVRAKAESMKSDYNQRKSGWNMFSDAMSSMGYSLGASEIKDTNDAIDKAANKVIETYYKNFESAGKQAQAAQATADLWQNVVDNLKQAKEKSEDALKNMRIEEARRKNDVVEQSLALQTQFRANDEIRRSQIYAMGIIKDRTLAPQMQFDALSNELDKARNQMNQKLIEAYELNKKLTTRPDMIASEYESYSKRRDDLLAEADKYASKAGVLENALAQIKNLVMTPDLSHMTSLAQYGFNMGEKDDTVVVMEKYYSKMTTLTKQIKDKLDQGLKTTATYD